MTKMNQAVGEKNILDKSGGRKNSSLYIYKDRVMEIYWVQYIESNL